MKRDRYSHHDENTSSSSPSNILPSHHHRSSFVGNLEFSDARAERSVTSESSVWCGGLICFQNQSRAGCWLLLALLPLLLLALSPCCWLLTPLLWLAVWWTLLSLSPACASHERSGARESKGGRKGALFSSPQLTAQIGKSQRLTRHSPPSLLMWPSHF